MRKRAIEVLQLAQRIAAEVDSGRVDDVEMSDKQVERVAGLLRPALLVERLGRAHVAHGVAVIPLIATVLARLPQAGAA
ncbi:hypothetical protein ACFYPX_08870 [Micromonospora zamorensis]|uniref:hypothetical protein n=1 Tax=Micromonospora zamorensis TaxID=709883 RepID=UPI0036CDA683